MKKFIYTIIALLGILMPNNVWAEEIAGSEGTDYNEAYAVLVMSSGEDTGKSDAYLTLYYDNKKSEHNEGVVVDLDKMTESPEIMQSRQYLHSVIFDQSFADCRPTSTKYWFANCWVLKTISGLEYLNTSEVTDMGQMFMECSELESIDLSHFNTSKVTNMNNMFYRNMALTSLDLSSFDTQNVTDMGYMFGMCENLTTIYVSSNWTTATVTTGDAMFYECSKLVGGNGTTYDENHTDYSYAHIDRADQPGYFTYGESSSKDDAEPYAVLSEDNTVLTFYYDEQKEARGGMSVGPFSGIPGDPSFQTWYLKGNINTVVFDDSFANCKSLTSTAYWFYGLSSLTTITGIGKLKTDNVTDMSGMFHGCGNLTTLDLSGFNTEKVTDMHDMFGFCSSLTSLDLSGFKTDNVTSMTSMFSGCERLTSLNLSNFSNTKTTSMQLMFENCYSLTDLNLSGFRTDNVTDMHIMFSNCSSLVNLDLSSFNTENVTDMDNMFQVCSSLTSLDLSGFKTDNVTSMRSMFGACYDLTTIYASDKWSVTNVTSGDYMFAGCTKLAGGAGTKYDENYSDYTYARIDGGPDNPGYFTDIADKGKEKMEQVATPEFSMKGDSIYVTCATEGAQIWYKSAAMDSTFNDNGWAIWSDPIYMTMDFKMIAMATKEGMEDSKADTLMYYYTEWQNLIETIKRCSDICDMIMNENPSESILNMIYDVEDRMHYDMRVYDENRLEWDRETIIEERKKLEDYISYIEQLWREEQKTTATYENYVLTVEGETTMAQALEQVGGRNVVAKDIAAIVWNSSETLTRSDIEGFGNPNLLIYVQTDSLAPEGVNNVVINGKAKSITLVDAESNNNFYAPMAFTAESISYTREFKQTTEKDVSRGWEGICLPFTVQKFTHESHGEIAPFGNDASIFHFWLHQMTDKGMVNATTIEANKPYIISMPNSSAYAATYNQAGKVTFAAKNVTIPATVFNEVWTADGKIAVLTTFAKLKADNNTYALNVNDGVDGYEEGSVFISNYRDVRPFEVYTYHTSRASGSRFISVSSLFGGESDDSTGIIDVMEKQNGEVVKVYSINGSLIKQGNRSEVMNNLPKGLYIIGNQKVMVK